LIRLARRHPDWTLGFQDETWWSRIAQPNLHCFSPGEAPLELEEKQVAKDDPGPKALACYGVLLRGQDCAADRLWLRFVDGRPLSGLTTQFLAWGSARLAAEGKRAWLLVWDNAPWHVSKEVREWVREHNRQVKAGQAQGVPIVLCFLPSKSPWLNPIEPKWVHCKRRVLEAKRVLTADEVEQRVCATFGCPRESHLAISASVS
jgi:transposase